MPPNLALLIGAVLVFFAFRSDRKRNIGDTSGLFWPSLWYIIVATRPLGYWLSLWGVPLPGGSDDPTDGSAIDRYFYGILTIIGLRILSRRRFEWGATFRRAPWLTGLLVFMAISIVWSQYPYVSFKRYIKVFGSIVMALVVLTTDSPLESIFTVLRRCLYIHLPMSLICTRYFRDIGVSYDWSGTHQAWQGISTTKNTLGQIAMLGILYFSWELWRHWKEHGLRNLHIIFLLIALFLLKGAEGSISMTSVSVCAFALLIFFRIQSLRSRPAAARSFIITVFCGTAALVTLVLIHSVVMFSEDSIFGQLITLFGRDITLTDRTYIWNDVYAAAAGNPVLGVGYGGFWIGRLANIPWNAHMTWVLGQGHSGYVDTYLQIGWIGGLLLGGTLISSLPRLLNSMADDFNLGCFRITLFLTIIFINITESTFLRGDHHLWFLFMLVLLPVPSNQAPLVDSESTTSTVGG